MKTLLSALLLLVASLPVRAADVRVCPPWQIEVVDAKGVPLRGCTVYQEWSCNFGVVCPIQSTNAVTDAQGKAGFPERWVGRPANLGTLKKLTARFSAYGEPIPSANIYVWKQGYDPVRVYSDRDPNVTATAAGLRSKITLRPSPPAK
jgi:hypothetical protein